MKYSELKKKVARIARVLFASFSEFSPEDVAKAEKIIIEFANDINKSIDKFKSKQIPALEKLQKKLKKTREDADKGIIGANEADRLCKNILNKMKTKQFYLDDDVPDADDFKNYTSENERYIDGIMRAGGANEAFECIAKVVSRNHQLSKTLSDFQTHYLNKFGTSSYVRTILGKQSANREILREFMKCAPKRLRTASFLKNLSDTTRNIMVDLVDAQGKIIAHTSVTAVALRDFKKLHSDMSSPALKDDDISVDHPGYWNNSPVASRNKRAGLRDVLRKMFGFFSGLLAKTKKVTSMTVATFKNLFNKAENASDQTEYACDQIMVDIEEFKRVMNKLV